MGDVFTTSIISLNFAFENPVCKISYENIRDHRYAFDTNYYRLKSVAAMERCSRRCSAFLHLFNIGQKPSKYMWILSLPLKLKVSCLELCLLWTLVWIFFKDFPHKGLLKTFKKSAGWTINKFWLNNSVAITGTILRSAYKEIDIQRRTFSNFWNFYCSYYQIIAVWILVSEGRDKKGAFVEISSSKYSILKSKMQGIFRPCFGSHRIK